MIGSGPPTHHAVLALTRGAHAVAGVGVGELSLEGSVLGARVPAPVVVVHVRLLAGVLHGVHVAFVSLGRGAVHAVHGPFVALLMPECRQLGAEGGWEAARFWKAGSLTSEKGSCTLTLLLDKIGSQSRFESERPDGASLRIELLCSVFERYLWT
ncbi:hypothetical protein EYF80_037235 [Liparis tanakae]|uniref:Uncharacterized protein n=1 Tax=Liparis tanakae TaxID=230148 RepID=A0A4Z2GG71_9TELE|nr:hypothetical protein EYF80_037235 [Liparis tanakae]